MARPKLRIGYNGHGALMNMFVPTAQEAMPDAVLYDRTDRFLAFRKNEIRLGQDGYVAPRSAVRDVPLDKLDVRLHFDQTLFTKEDIRTTVTVIQVQRLQMQTLQLSAKEDLSLVRDVEAMFRAQSLRVVAAIRQLSGPRVVSTTASHDHSNGSVGRRGVPRLPTGLGRGGGKAGGPLGI